MRTAILLLIATAAVAQAPASTPSPTTGTESSGTSTDLFIMFGSDFDRPGLGHTFGFLKKNPFGDELTFAYTYENSGSHGFLHTSFGEHTEQLGLMKNFPLPATKRVSGYPWLQTGPTTHTGNPHALNRLDSSASLGAIVHFDDHNAIWIQESWSKVITVPLYTTSSIGYTWSW
jgi:hypothetical protein